MIFCMKWHYALTAVCLALLGGHLPSAAQSFSDGYTFVLPPYDSVESPWLPVFTAEAADRPITAEGPHFLREGQPFRFWGVNLTTGANFPPKQLAPAIAARLHKMGINLVRLHHMDNNWTSSQGNIFMDRKHNTRQLNPQMLDRLHYFIAQLKRKGIYANVNLHVSREFRPADGMPYADSLAGPKCYTMFDPRAIFLQKEYARKLLTATNPYTGLSLATDPAVAMVEITNENSIYQYWRYNALRPFSQGGILTRYHSRMLDSLWNAFLHTKYGTDAALRAAWQGQGTGWGRELLTNGRFEAAAPLEGWDLEQHNGARATPTPTSAAYEGNYAVQLQIDQSSSEAWHLQWVQYELSLSRDSTYVVQFYARSDRKQTIEVALMQDHPPYDWYGGRVVQLTPQWQHYTFQVRPYEDNQGGARITFSFGNAHGTIWIDSVSIRARTQTALHDDERLEDKNIRRIRYDERHTFTEARTIDMGAFYLQLQRQYYQEMYHYLKDSLKVRAPITGTNGLHGLFETWSQQDLDYIDDHAYWDHPEFPNIPWDPWDWRIDNRPMYRDTGYGTLQYVFSGLAMADKPYTISEYNHCAPNVYQAEMLPLLTAYSALHGVDGIMWFDYIGGDPPDWTTDFVDNWFSLHRNTAVMAQMPLFAYAYRNGLIAESPQKLRIRYDSAFIYRLPLLDDAPSWELYLPYDRRHGSRQPIVIERFDADSSSIPAHTVRNGAFWDHSQHIHWDPTGGHFAIVSKRFETFAGDQPWHSPPDSAVLEIVSLDDFTLLSLLSTDGQSLSTAHRALLCITTNTQNTDMQWDGSHTVHSQWGKPPTLNRPARVILRLRIQSDSVVVFPLDTLGLHRDSFTFYPEGGEGFYLLIDQRTVHTPWFGLRIYRTTTTTQEPTSRPSPLSSTQTSESIIVHTRQSPALRTLQLVDLFGKTVYSTQAPKLPVHTIDIRQLPSGVYFLVGYLSDGQRHVKRFIVK